MFSYQNSYPQDLRSKDHPMRIHPSLAKDSGRKVMVGSMSLSGASTRRPGGKTKSPLTRFGSCRGWILECYSPLRGKNWFGSSRRKKGGQYNGQLLVRLWVSTPGLLAAFVPCMLTLRGDAARGESWMECLIMEGRGPGTGTGNQHMSAPYPTLDPSQLTIIKMHWQHKP